MVAFDWLDELAQPKRDVWLPDNTVIEGATPASGANPEPQAPPEIVQDEPLPEPSPMIASNDPEFRPPARNAEPEDEPAFDWRRALSHLFGGNEAVSAYDRNRLAQMQQKAQARQGELDTQLKLRKDRREQELHNATMPKREAEAADLTSKASARELQIAGSQASKATVASVAAGLRMQAQRIRATDPQIADMMQSTADNMENNPGMTGAAAIRLLDKFGRFGQQISHDALKGKQLDQQAAQAWERNKLAWAKINAARASAANKESDRVRAVQAEDQAKLDEEIEKADWARRQLLRIAELSEKVNTGPVASFGQGWLQKVDLTSPEFNEIRQLVALFDNEEIKRLSGSAVTGNEWTRMLAALPTVDDDDENFDQKVAMMLEIAEAAKQKAINRYTRGDGGAPTQQTNTAKRVTAQAPSVTPGETPPPDATPQPKPPKPWPGAQPGQQKRDKATGIVWEMQPDGTLKAVK